MIKTASSRLLDFNGGNLVKELLKKDFNPVNPQLFEKINREKNMQNKAKRIAIEQDRTIFSIMVCGDLVMKKQKGQAWIKY